MLSTPDLHRVVTLVAANQWRLALIGDPRQLQGVGRGGLLDELCANGRVDQLERLHRFKHPWEAAASLLVRSGDPRAFDAYEAHGRIIPGTLEEHLARMADTWITNHQQRIGRERWWRRRTTTSTPSTGPSNRPGSTPATSTPSDDTDRRRRTRPRR